jgi:hypothetical protein
MNDAEPGWYPDAHQRAELRWWDGQRWTEHVANGGVAGHDPITAPAAASTSTGVDASAARPSDRAEGRAAVPPAMADAARAASALGAGSAWQVVVGPVLPTFSALGGSSVKRSLGSALRNPPVLLLATTLLAVLPALATDTIGAGTWAPARLAMGLIAAAGVAIAPRLTGRARTIARLLPLAFIALQLVAMATTVSSFVAGDSGFGAAVPHLVGGLLTLWSAAFALRRHGPRSEPVDSPVSSPAAA